MRKRTDVLCCALVLLAMGAKQLPAQAWTRAGALGTWVFIQPYDDTSRSMLCANWSNDEWHVFAGRDSVYVRREAAKDRYDSVPVASTYRAPFRVVAVANGWLVGYNHGEFGGSIWWYARDGRDSAKVSDEQIVAFVKMREGLIGVAGHAHLGIHEGRVLTLAQDRNGRWKVTPILELGDAPETVVLESDTALLIVGATGLMRARITGAKPEARLERLIVTRPWGMLYPTSAVRDPSGLVYVGMRFAVMRLAPRDSSYEERWLVPPQCRTIRRDPAFDSTKGNWERMCHCDSNP